MLKILKCKEACALLSQSQDRKLSRRERLSVWLHLMICQHCRRYRKQMLFIRQNIQKWQQQTTDD